MARAEIVVLSHLSNAQFEFEHDIKHESAQKRFEFIKRLISRMNGDLNQEVTDEELHFQWETLDLDPYTARLQFEEKFGYYNPINNKS